MTAATNDAYIREAADRVMIQDLVSRYAFFGDYGPNEAWADLFTPDAKWEIAGANIVVRGREQLLKLVSVVRAWSPLSGTPHIRGRTKGLSRRFSRPP